MLKRLFFSTILGLFFGFMLMMTVAAFTDGKLVFDSPYLKIGGALGFLFGIYLCILKYRKNCEIKKQQKIQQKISEQQYIRNCLINATNKTNDTKNYSSLIDSMNATYPQHKSFILQCVYEIKDIEYKNAIQIFLQCIQKNSWFSFVFANIEALSDIEIFSKDTRISLSVETKFDYSRNSHVSIFAENKSVAEIIQDIKGRKNYYEKVYNYMSSLIKHEIGEMLDKKMNYSFIFNRIVLADGHEPYIDDMLNALVYFAIADDFDVDKYTQMLRICEIYYLRDSRDINNNSKDFNVLSPVDLMIAKILNYSRGGIIDNINKQLEEWLLHGYLSWHGFKKSIEICDTLSKVLHYLKARKQEEMVLEAMFKLNLPRTAQHESRLAFLKKGIDDVPNIINEKFNGQELLYDYRSIKWDSKQIKSYFENLTINQELLTTPLLIDEWKHNITVDDFVWDIDKTFDIIKETLNEEFNSRLVCDKINTSAITDTGTEAVPSIVISTNQESMYPWLSIIVIGDQLARSNVDLAIYSIFRPDKIQLNIKNIAESNSILCNKMLVLKEGQNPRITRLIESVKAIITKELEFLFNTPDTLEAEVF